ncbi:MAG: hypothetical protein AB7I27_15740 [Bacteriovoracaceae bacterium]
MKYLLISFLSFFTGSCNTDRVVVSNADKILEYQILKRVPLYSEQKIALSKDIDVYLNHTRPIANQVIPILDELKENNNYAQIEFQYHRLEHFYKDLAISFSALISKYLARLDKKQQKEFIENLEYENSRQSRKNAKDHLHEAEERFIKFFGPIHEKQKIILISFQDHFNQRALEKLNKKEKITNHIKEIYAEELSVWSTQRAIYEEFKNFQNHQLSTKKNLEIIKRIYPTLSEVQKEYFRMRIQELKGLLNYFIQADF